MPSRSQSLSRGRAAVQDGKVRNDSVWRVEIESDGAIRRRIGARFASDVCRSFVSCCCCCCRPEGGTLALAESLFVGAMAQEQKDDLEEYG